MDSESIHGGNRSPNIRSRAAGSNEVTFDSGSLLVSKEGWMDKWRTSKLANFTNSSWQHLYFELNATTGWLYYWKDEQRTKPCKNVGLKLMHVETIQRDLRDSTQLQFEYALKDKVYCLRAPDEAEREEWFEVIHATVRHHRRRRAIRSITAGHLVDPADAMHLRGKRPSADRFSIDDIRSWAAQSAAQSSVNESGADGLKRPPRSIKMLGDHKTVDDTIEPAAESDEEHLGGTQGLARTTSALHPATSSSVAGAGSSPTSIFRRRLQKFESAHNLGGQARVLRCANERCLEELKKPRKHQCHICYKDFCEYCVHKRRIESDGGKSRVVVCDICFYSIARNTGEDTVPTGIGLLGHVVAPSSQVAGAVEILATANAESEPSSARDDSRDIIPFERCCTHRLQCISNAHIQCTSTKPRFQL
eukprot:SAG31_NODE_3952_length_3722_cov_5.626553_2_plen_420_part_00